MKICIVSNFKDSGYGESTRPYHLSKELVRHGHKIIHLCNKKLSYKDRIIYYYIIRLQNYPTLIIRVIEFIALWLTIKIFKPDIIYAHQFNNARWALATKIFRGIPIVFDAHTSVYFEGKTFGENQEKITYVRNIEQNICNKSNYIIAASEPTKKILISEYKISSEKIFVVGNGTYIMPSRKTTATNNKNFICCCTLPFDGFRSNELALGFLFEVAAILNRISKDIEIHILGGGVKPKPTSSNIIYTGFVDNLELYLSKSDVCLAPYPESAVCGGIRNKVCDYLAVGKAIISTREGMRGFIDLINGLHYIEGNSAEEFANAIILVKNDRILREKLEINALSKASEYHWLNRGNQLNDFFKKII